MKTNLFLRSTLRQPVKTAMLLIVTALITFAFVMRVSEYLLVQSEVERLSGYYRSVGTVERTPLRGGRQANADEAISCLEENPYVDTVNRYQYTSAVIQDDFCNADTDLLLAERGGSRRNYMFFYGTLYSSTQGADGAYRFFFSADTVLTGLPEYIQEGQPVTLFAEISPQNEESLAEAYAGMEKGVRYLVLGWFRDDGKCGIVMDVDPEGMVETKRTVARFCPLAEDGVWYYPVPDGQEADFSVPELAGVAETIQQVRDEQHALNVVRVKDMSCLPAAQTDSSQIYLTDGRWLDREDDASGRKVCVINAGLANLRGLQVGSTVTLGLRDISSCFGYFISGSAAEETCTDTYEIVGIYEYLNSPAATCFRNNIYLPDSAVPETFVQGGNLAMWSLTTTSPEQMPYPDTLTFSLKSPEQEQSALSSINESLAPLKYQAVLLENNWRNFYAAAEPMQKSSLYNAALYALVTVIVLSLLVFLFFRLRRKDIAIARALGVPAAQCTAQLLLTSLLAGLPGVLIGGVLGWRYAAQNAAYVLESLESFGGGTMVSLPVVWLVFLYSVLIVLQLTLTLCGAGFLSTRPVLPLLQGSTAARKERMESPSEAVTVQQPVFSSAPVYSSTLPVSTGGSGVPHILRFVFRHIRRARLKSALTILLAAGFTVGLAAIRLSIVSNSEKVDSLYHSTIVKAEIRQADATQLLKGGGIIRGDTVRALMDTGFLTDIYLEGSTVCYTAPYDPDTDENIPETGMRKTLMAFADEAAFLSHTGSGENVTITYFDGWDGSLFAEEWTKDGGPCPIILPQTLCCSLEIEEGDSIGLFYRGFQSCMVAGYYTGTVSLQPTEPDAVLIPLSAYQILGGSRVTYSRVCGVLDPARNRELTQFEDAISAITVRQGMGIVGLRAVIWDEELRTAVAPLENSVELMQVLYPVTLVLSLLVAAGIAVLFVMTSAKEAAIMRVLGTSKLKSRLMLALQTVFTSAAGLVVGVLGILAYTGRTRPDLFVNLLGASALCAVLYLLAAVLGAVLSAAAVTRRNPLELLQVKE